LSAVLLRLAYLGVTNAFAMLRLLPMSNRDKEMSASLVAVRWWSPTPPTTVPDQRAGDPRIR
jgi:hypothetical protein